MYKKIVGILVCTLMIVSGSVSFFATAKNIETTVETANVTYDVGLCRVMFNGDCSESYATTTCYEFDDVHFPYGTTLSVIIRVEYKIDCWGLWDWGKATGTVNGNKKEKETDSNKHGYWEWPMTISETTTISYTLYCRGTDSWSGCDKKDDCPGSFKFIEDTPNPPHLKLNTEYVDFGKIEPGDVSYRTVTLTNDGGQTATGEIKRSGSSCFKFTDGGGTFTLPAGNSREIKMSFTPSDWDKTYTGELIVDGDEPCNDVSADLEGRSKEKSKVIFGEEINYFYPFWLNNFLQKYFENRPNTFPLLRQIMGY